MSLSLDINNIKHWKVERNREENTRGFSCRCRRLAAVGQEVVVVHVVSVLVMVDVHLEVVGCDNTCGCGGHSGCGGTLEVIKYRKLVPMTSASVAIEAAMEAILWCIDEDEGNESSETPLASLCRATRGRELRAKDVQYYRERIKQR